jgi:aspartate aminotransferase
VRGRLADFGAGEPHFATPRHIKDAAIEAIEKNFTRYTAVAGVPEVRKAMVERHACDFGSNYTVEECVFTTGGKLALFNAIQVLVDHGDEVILPVPYWVSSRTSSSMRAARWCWSRATSARTSALPRR